LSDYLKEHTDDPQAFSALIDSLKTELQAASVILSPLTLDLDGDGMVETAWAISLRVSPFLTN
jgi:hypothetical protein